MRRYLLLATIGLVCLLTSCGQKEIVLWDEDIYPGPYLGGEITAVSYKILGPSRVQICWEEDFEDEDGFTVKRILIGSSCDQIAVCDANVTVIVDSTAELGQEYVYDIAACKNGIESVGGIVDFRFLPPSPSNVGSYFNWSQPNRIKLVWSNNATWADSIVIAKKVGAQAWVPLYAVVPGSATEFVDEYLDSNVMSKWSFKTYYQNHISDQTLYSFKP